jgi:hypothetical protein
MMTIINKNKEVFGAKNDQDHIRLVVEMNPKVPNRNLAICEGGEDCGPYL